VPPSYGQVVFRRDGAPPTSPPTDEFLTTPAVRSPPLLEDASRHSRANSGLLMQITLPIRPRHPLFRHCIPSSEGFFRSSSDSPGTSMMLSFRVALRSFGVSARWLRSFALLFSLGDWNARVFYRLPCFLLHAPFGGDASGPWLFVFFRWPAAGRGLIAYLSCLVSCPASFFLVPPPDAGLFLLEADEIPFPRHVAFAFFFADVGPRPTPSADGSVSLDLVRHPGQELLGSGCHVHPWTGCTKVVYPFLLKYPFLILFTVADTFSPCGSYLVVSIVVRWVFVWWFFYSLQPAFRGRRGLAVPTIGCMRTCPPLLVPNLQASDTQSSRAARPGRRFFLCTCATGGGLLEE